MSDDNERYDPELVQRYLDKAQRELDQEDWWEMLALTGLAIFAGWFLLGGMNGVLLVAVIAVGVALLCFVKRATVAIIVIIVWALVLIPAAVHILGQTK